MLLKKKDLSAASFTGKTRKDYLVLLKVNVDIY